MENVKGNTNGEISMPDEHEQCASFLTEEFKENWNYIRHIEEIRLKHTHIFLIITGAVISIFSFMIKFQDKGLIEESFSVLSKIIISQYGWAIVTGSGFIFLYGFFLCIFLAMQKRGYQHHRIVNAEIRKWFTNKCKLGQFSFETELSRKRTILSVIKSTFFYWYLLIVLINVFAFMVLSIAFLGLIVPSWSLKYSIILSVSLSVSIFIIECYVFYKINKNITIGPA